MAKGLVLPPRVVPDKERNRTTIFCLSLVGKMIEEAMEEVRARQRLIMFVLLYATNA